jgi:hypothetical protein
MEGLIILDMVIDGYVLHADPRFGNNIVLRI